MLYAFDAYPNVILCFTAGFLINERLLGMRRSILLFTSFVLIGEILLTISAVYDSFPLAITSRVIMGIGVECQNVTFYALIALWFSEKEHGKASAASAMMMRLGMVSAEFFTPLIQHHFGDLRFPFGVAAIVAFGALLCAIAVVMIDSYNSKIIKQRLHRQDTLEVRYKKRHEHDLEFYDHHTDAVANSGAAAKVEVKPLGTWEIVKSFKTSFWVFNVVVLLAYSTFVPFFANISMLLRYCFDFSLVEAGQMMALPSLIVTLTCPLLGYISDKIQRRGYLLAFSVLLSASTQVYIL